jgi:septal ring factor EnvC (AmiA/AmiB activator)
LQLTSHLLDAASQVAQLQAQLSCKSTEAAGLTRKLAAVDPLTDALEAELRAMQQGLAKVTARVQGQEAGLKGHEKRLLEMVQVRVAAAVAAATG